MVTQNVRAPPTKRKRDPMKFLKSFSNQISSRTLSCAFVNAIFIRFGSPRASASASLSAREGFTFAGIGGVN